MYNGNTARAQRVSGIFNRYNANVRATRSYRNTVNRANAAYTANGGGDFEAYSNNLRKADTKKYSRSTYMGLRNALGGANDNPDFIQVCVLENRPSRRIAEIAGSTPAHAA